MAATNDNDFMVSSGFHVSMTESIKELYRKAAEECDARGCIDFGCGSFQVISEVNQGSMMYCIVAQFWYG